MSRPLSAALCLALLAAPCLAQAQAPGPFRWGADKTGGAPYLYDDPADPRRMIGFEVELADLLAAKLGRPGAEHIQGEWKNLPDLLVRGRQLDVVMNGYEFDPNNEKQYPSCVPYYIYTLKLTVRTDDGSIRTWDDLRAKPGERKKRVGVLTGSAAMRYVEKVFGDSVERLGSDDVANCYDLVARGQGMDATVQDSASTTYFTQNDYKDKLWVVGEGREPGYYVILTRPEDAELRGSIDATLRAAVADGSLESIYRKYGLWNEDQAKLAELAAPGKWPPGATSPRVIDWPYLWRELLWAAWVTVKLTVLAMPLAMLIGLLVAVGRLYGPRLLAVPLTLYVEVIRGTPLLLQLYVLFYPLPRILPWLNGLEPIYFAVIGLAINYSAYEAENYRAGLLAVPRGQMEASLALGLTRGQALRYVVVPQAVRNVIPPVTNDFIALFKDTSVCSVILVSELTRRYNELYNGNRDILLELAAITAGLYLLMSVPLSLLARRLEHRSPQEKA